MGNTEDWQTQVATASGGRALPSWPRAAGAADAPAPTAAPEPEDPGPRAVQRPSSPGTITAAAAAAAGTAAAATGPAVAGAPPGPSGSAPRPARRRRAALVGVLTVAIALAAAAVVVTQLVQPESRQVAAGTKRPLTSSRSATRGAGSPGSTPAADPSTTTATTTPVPANVTPASGLYANGKMELQGDVSTALVHDQLVAKAAAVVGPGNVVDQLRVVPGAPPPTKAPVRIADSVLFDSGSAVIKPDFAHILDLGILLLKQNPKVTITVIGYTDNTGTPAANMALAAQRVDAVIAYQVQRGIDASRFVPEPRGAEAPVADNTTPDGRRLNRRIEFEINNLLD